MRVYKSNELAKVIESPSFAYLELCSSDVELVIDERSGTIGILFHEFESSSGMGMLLMETVGSAAIREEDHNLVDCLRVLGEEILPGCQRPMLEIE